MALLVQITVTEGAVRETPREKDAGFPNTFAIPEAHYERAPVS
jgi:hypothetical protein